MFLIPDDQDRELIVKANAATPGILDLFDRARNSMILTIETIREIISIIDQNEKRIISHAEALEKIQEIIVRASFMLARDMATGRSQENREVANAFLNKDLDKLRELTDKE